MNEPEDLDCIPYIDGVVHPPHFYTPDDYYEELSCEGVNPITAESSCDEHRVVEKFRLAMWVNYGGVRTLHKTRVAQSLEEAQSWLAEYQEDFKEGKWFIVKDVTEVRSYVVA